MAEALLSLIMVVVAVAATTITAVSGLSFSYSVVVATETCGKISKKPYPNGINSIPFF